MLSRTHRAMALPRAVSSARRRWLSTEQLSIRHGPTEPPLFPGTIPEHFSSIVSRHGDRTAVVARTPSPSSTERTLTYHALDLESNRLASSLSSLGVHKGDRVAISLGNCIEFAALTYALFKLGAVLVPLNPSFNAAQVTAALRHLSVKLLVIGAVTDLAYKPGRGRSNSPLIRHLSSSETVPSLTTIVVVDNHYSTSILDGTPPQSARLTPYSTLLEGSSRPIIPTAPLAPSDTINIQFTSGTTSNPKAAMLSHSSILNNGALIAHRMGLAPSDRIVVPPPLFHCFGSVLGYMATATTGAAILFPSPAFDPHAALRMCVDHAATGLYGVPTMFVAFLDALDASTPQPQHLRKGIAGGSSIPEPLMSRIHQRLGLRDLVICYGMTETSPVSCMTAPSDPLARRCNSVGTPMPHTAVKIVDPSNRERIVPLGCPGELAAAGYLVMSGYSGDPQQTAEALVKDPQDGLVWMHSGDEAVMDEDGFVTITGRIKELIIRAGENIHPLEIENCLGHLDGVHQVSVAGVPDAILGEAVAAFIIPQAGWSTSFATSHHARHGAENGAENGASHGEKGVLTKQRVRSWVQENLSSHLVPKYVFWVDNYPKTASGKIQKFKLSDMAKDMLSQGL